ncbi:hypothetical protein LOAG_11376 [Loa loa]|uniref:LIM zinc-binding domain-containing protein n=1 Tax=Loa loa TaxID=7209 RepID=A0A1S0TPK9_LOALO|nr:hypothetical protein LOAG_11376 [Loa loa]EFO17124.1 hypothetical protein LOAG_11376 [Loa loa]
MPGEMKNGSDSNSISKIFKTTVCNKALRETCVIAMNKLWHRCCFTCTKCHSPFENGEFLIYNEKPYDIDCYYLTKYENEFTPMLSNQSGPIIGLSGTDHKSIDQITEKSIQKSPIALSQLQLPLSAQNTELRKYPLSMIPIPM